MTLKRSLSRFIGAADSTDISLSAGLRLSPRHDIFGINCSPYGTGGGGYTTVTVSGTSPLLLPKAKANSLQYVKAFGGTEQRNLPDNYIQRQYIYMPEGSHIKVEDLPISADYKVEFDFQTLTLSSPLRNYLGGRVGGVSAGGGFRLSKLANSNNNRVVLYGFESGTEYYDPTTQFQANTRYKYTYNNGVCTLESGGSVVSTKTFTVTDNTSTNWGINTYGNGTYWQTESDGIYVYSLKVWNGQGELVMDLVPAVQKGTVPVVCFYDTVTGNIREATAGTFMAGPEAVPTPDAPMDIVSNNGVLKVDNQGNIYTDGTVETINVHGKNLFDKTTYIAGKYYNSSGDIVESPNYGMSGFIPMKSGQTFALSGRTPSGIAIFNTSQVWQRQITGQSFTAPYDGYFVASVAAGQQDTLQVELGSTATTYEPYFDGGTATAEILLKVGNYRDVHSIIDGVVTRNVGILVLDGTESWTAQDANYPYFRVDFSQDFSESTYLKGGKCTHFKDRYITPTTNQQGFYLNRDSVTQKTFIALRFDSLFPATSENVNNLKTWLADQYSSGTPVIVIYPLATPTTETVTGQTLQVTDGDNTLEITQASLAGLELEAKYKKTK